MCIIRNRILVMVVAGSSDVAAVERLLTHLASYEFQVHEKRSMPKN